MIGVFEVFGSIFDHYGKPKDKSNFFDDIYVVNPQQGAGGLIIWQSQDLVPKGNTRSGSSKILMVPYGVVLLEGLVRSMQSIFTVFMVLL